MEWRGQRAGVGAVRVEGEEAYQASGSQVLLGEQTAGQLSVGLYGKRLGKAEDRWGDVTEACSAAVKAKPERDLDMSTQGTAQTTRPCYHERSPPLRTPGYLHGLLARADRWQLQSCPEFG